VGKRPLRCPLCGHRFEADLRLCPRCSVPLGPAEGQEGRESRLRREARKIDPALAQGPLVVLVRARNEAEAEFLRGLLLEFGIPAVLRRASDLQAPDPFSGGPFELLVAASGLQAAREALQPRQR
jgi:hypothetical protein